MGRVQISDYGMTKKWGKSAKIRSNFKLQYLKFLTYFQRLESTTLQQSNLGREA